MVENQYYPSDIFSLGENEVMVELGANDGRTLLEFLDKVNRKYNCIYCFEPDKMCIEQLKRIIDKEKGCITLIERGAWDKKACLSFYSDPEHGASHIVENDVMAEDVILVDSVDDCVDSIVTYMKMDIEGAELKALQGAKNVIKQFKPKLAVCVYHNKEDILDVVDYLSELVPEYRFYLRHHNWAATETVLYAMV